jgi:membrane-bound lytic murein transglycosylase D
MLKRKLVRAGLFGNGLLFMIASVNSTNDPQPGDSAKNVVVDPFVRQLQAFDSSFIDLNEFPAMVIANAPKIELSSRTQKFVSDYNKKNSEALEKIRERGNRYFPIMDSIFSCYHLPIELKYLAAVESELKSKAISRVGAAGPWQLMPSTARELSLKIRGKYDERTNYYKSTAAAAKYLRDLYKQFGDWLLVIAAYNSGPGKVQWAIKMSGSHSFWRLQNFLPAETRGHVKRFIATHYFFEGGGGITTLTKNETGAYRKSISEFIAKQRAELAKNETPKTDAAKGHMVDESGVNSGELALAEKK